MKKTSMQKNPNLNARFVRNIAQAKQFFSRMRLSIVSKRSLLNVKPAAEHIGTIAALKVIEFAVLPDLSSAEEHTNRHIIDCVLYFILADTKPYRRKDLAFVYLILMMTSLCVSILLTCLWYTVFDCGIYTCNDASTSESDSLTVKISVEPQSQQDPEHSVEPSGPLILEPRRKNAQLSGSFDCESEPEYTQATNNPVEGNLRVRIKHTGDSNNPREIVWNSTNIQWVEGPKGPTTTATASTGTTTHYHYSYYHYYTTTIYFSFTIGV
ncbi:hypothetical protein MAR_021752 [Mya arenaria]|uniref:Uncharacterized protein n=1 Tax=Mya arenaria TaxID=6604 RepID=A0ABY7ECE5_MYAAR|nr:hypothetical protein MAR_021752 [Mya arenaria]